MASKGRVSGARHIFCHVTRDASLFNTSSIFLPPNFRHLRVASDRDNSPPRLGEQEELILHRGRVNDGQIKTCFPRPYVWTRGHMSRAPRVWG